MNNITALPLALNRVSSRHRPVKNEKDFGTHRTPRSRDRGCLSDNSRTGAARATRILIHVIPDPGDVLFIVAKPPLLYRIMAYSILQYRRYSSLL